MSRINIRMRVFLLLVGAAVILGAMLLARSTQPPALSAEVIALNSGDAAAGFARADHVRPFVYPDDQGPHPEYQTEWWYYTGNLETASGRHFGYQLTIFRRALTPTLTTRESDWATNQIYFAHFALTDVQANEHFATERFSRGAAGLAGATGNPHRVWLEDWEINQVTLQTPSPGGAVSGALPPSYALRLHAEDSGHALDLTLRSPKPPVLNGDRGLSQKSAAVGNASYYFSLTHLNTEGTLIENGKAFDVKGTSWMDQEFGTTSLGPQAVGWDWFSVQLGDGRELMLFHIRQKDGSIEPLSGGTLVNPDGSTRHLQREEINISVLDRWTSPATHATYPARWLVAIPSANIDVTLRPYIPDQEMRVSFTYWEGAVEITGTSAGAPVKGSGYVELTGYAAPLAQ